MGRQFVARRSPYPAVRKSLHSSRSFVSRSAIDMLPGDLRVAKSQIRRKPTHTESFGSTAAPLVKEYVFRRRLLMRRAPQTIWRAMEIKTPVAATVLLAFVAYTVDQWNGATLFIDAPHGTILSAAVASSNAQAAVNYIFWNTTTDALLEAPAPEQIRVTQSSS